LIPTLVDRESLASALAINSVIFNLARFIGPALAGIVIAEIGIAAAFAANAVSYIAFQISLLNLRGLLPRRPGGRRGADGDPERISRVAPRAGARRDPVGQLLAGDAVPAQTHGGRAGMLAHGRDRRPSMPPRLNIKL
jgi:hypothetical protein